MSRSVAVVGAGLAGVAAAGALAARGFVVTLLDKSPRVGGRMATRRVEVPGLGLATFDHGAQRLIDDSPDATNFLAAGPGLTTWGVDATGRPVYCSPGGMRAAVERLAAGLPLAVEVRTAARVTGVFWDESGWVVAAADRTERFDWLVLTPPLPQALDLLGNMRADLDPALAAVQYTRCVALLAAGRGETRLPAGGGVWLDTEPLRAVVDNHLKGVSAVGPAVTIHAAAGASESLWDEPDDVVTARMLGWAAEWVELAGPTTAVHRWRYNRPLTPWPEPCYAAPNRRLVLAGDAFGGPSLAGAYRSGLAAAEAVT